MEREYKGLSVVFKTQQEYKTLQDFLGKDIAYIDWVSQMEETETGLVIIDNTGLFSAGSVGSAIHQRTNGFRTVNFDQFFRIPTPDEKSVEPLFIEPRFELEKYIQLPQIELYEVPENTKYVMLHYYSNGAGGGRELWFKDGKKQHIGSAGDHPNHPLPLFQDISGIVSVGKKRFIVIDKSRT